MTKYTKTQIREAIREGHGRQRDWTIPDWEVDMYQDFLDALPEPQCDEWQECDPDEIRQGDRYLLQAENWHCEGVIEGDPTKDDIVLAMHPSGGGIMLAGVDRPSMFDRKNTALYRIPAPPTPPDPEVHEVILVFAIKGHDYMISEGRQLMIWDGVHYVNSEHTLFPETITEWDAVDTDKLVIADD